MNFTRYGKMSTALNIIGTMTFIVFIMTSIFDLDGRRALLRETDELTSIFSKNPSEAEFIRVRARIASIRKKYDESWNIPGICMNIALLSAIGNGILVFKLNRGIRNQAEKSNKTASAPSLPS